MVSLRLIRARLNWQKSNRHVGFLVCCHIGDADKAGNGTRIAIKVNKLQKYIILIIFHLTMYLQNIGINLMIDFSDFFKCFM